MTNRDIKLELTKIAMTCGMSIERAKEFYDWITEEPERVLPEGKPTKWDDTPIVELASRTRIEGTILKRCRENDINTVGDLIRLGAHKFGKCHNVGRHTISVIDEALEEHFQIPDWYTT